MAPLVGVSLCVNGSPPHPISKKMKTLPVRRNSFDLIIDLFIGSILLKALISLIKAHKGTNILILFIFVIPSFPLG
jgi:hypothetical protein